MSDFGDLGWSRYISSQEDSAYLTCEEHRAKFGLPPDSEYECECEIECPGHDTCPLGGGNK